jgi:hypothetical protein
MNGEMGGDEMKVLTAILRSSTLAIETEKRESHASL